MKTGMHITDLAQELDRQRKSKRDFLVDTRALAVTGMNAMSIDSVAASFEITEYAHRQIAEYLDIPAKYYNRLRTEDHEGHFQQMLNYWFQGGRPVTRMVRTLDGKARAILSDSYRRIDNYDVMEMATNCFLQRDDLTIDSCDVTESKLYLKASFARTEREVVEGDVVCFGIVVTNSEIGDGAFRVQPFVNRLVCTNGLIIPQYAIKQVHSGPRNLIDAGELQIELSSEAQQATDNAIMLQLRDAINTLLSDEKIESIRTQMFAAATHRIAEDPPKVIEMVGEKFGLKTDETGGIMRHLIEGGDLTAWGYVNAVTAVAGEVENYDRATELETIGGRMLMWRALDWKRLTETSLN